MQAGGRIARPRLGCASRDASGAQSHVHTQPPAASPARRHPASKAAQPTLTMGCHLVTSLLVDSYPARRSCRSLMVLGSGAATGPALAPIFSSILRAAPSFAPPSPPSAPTRSERVSSAEWPAGGDGRGRGGRAGVGRGAQDGRPRQGRVCARGADGEDSKLRHWPTTADLRRSASSCSASRLLTASWDTTAQKDQSAGA
jgi:hypothetical protein